MTYATPALGDLRARSYRYLYDETSGKLHREVAHNELRDWLGDDSAYVGAMHAIGQVPVIDLGQPKAGTAGADGRAPAEPALGRDSVIPSLPARDWIRRCGAGGGRRTSGTSTRQ